MANAWAVRDQQATSPIFVVGVPRSGTTLLQAFLSQSSDTYSLPETHFFSSLLPNLGKTASDALAPEELQRARYMIPELMGWEIPEQDFAPMLRSAVRGQFQAIELFEYLLVRGRPVEESDRRLRPVEKTPEHIEYMFTLRECYPQAQFVHVIRDPRNAISSWLATPFARSRWIPFYTTYWRLALSIAMRFGEKHPEAITSVSYEELVLRPEKTMSLVCEFLGISFGPEMAATSGKTASRIVAAEEETWKIGVFSKGIYYEPHAWRDRLDKADAWMIERQTAKEMEEHGYVAETKVGSRERAEAVWRAWRLPGSDEAAREQGLWLIGRCLEHGEHRAARILALFVAAGDWRMVMNSAPLREALL